MTTTTTTTATPAPAPAPAATPLPWEGYDDRDGFAALAAERRADAALFAASTLDSRAALSRAIRASWPDIVRRALGAGMRDRLESAALDALPAGPLRLAGSSTKIAKGEAHGVTTAVIYLAPAGEVIPDWSRICPGSTAACRAACLIHSGRMGMRPVKASRLWRTALYLGAPDVFWALARLDLLAVAGEARRKGTRAAFRVNGTSDIETPGLFEFEAREHLDVALYGYTKSFTRAMESALIGTDEAYSWDGREQTREMAHKVLREGGRVSIVFDHFIPDTWDGFPVVDGDVTDAVFTRPRGVVLGLSLKGTRKAKAAARAGGFAQPAVAS